MPNVLTMPEQRAGAMPDDWNTLAWGLELTEDLLPVVSYLDAEISPQSHMKALGKTPSLYNGARRVVGMTGWTQHVTTIEEVTAWQKERDYGICIQTRRVRAIDVDVSDVGLAQEVHDYIAQQIRLPKRFRDNASKFLLVLMLEGDYRKRVIETAHGRIEFLATGQQFIACGTHTSGARYEWEGGLPSSIPSMTEAEVNDLWNGLQLKFGVAPSVESKASTRHEVLNNAIVVDPIAQHLIAAQLVLGIGTDKKMNIICPWKEQHSMDSGDTETVYYPAHTNGHAHGAFKCLHAGCEKRSQQEFLDAVGYLAPDLFEDIVDEPEAEDASKLKYQFVLGDVYTNRPSPKWHVKKVLPESPLVMIFGASGSGKSFFALDLGMAVARGIEWRGHKVTQSPVAYVCAEGASGFANRMRAYAHQHDIQLNQTHFYTLDAAPNMTNKADVVALARGIKACGATLVFIDTWAQVTPGANENSGEEMGAALALCRGLHNFTGATVVLIHHAGKDSSKGARGWSGSHAAADAVIEVIRVDNYRAASVVKMKDGEDGAEFAFALETVGVGFDDEDEPIESCVLVHNETAARPEVAKIARAKKPRRYEMLALNTLIEMDFDPEVGVSYSQLSAEMKRQTVRGEGKDRRMADFKAEIELLAAEGRLVIDGDMVRNVSL